MNRNIFVLRCIDWKTFYLENLLLFNHVLSLVNRRVDWFIVDKLKLFELDSLLYQQTLLNLNVFLKKELPSMETDIWRELHGDYIYTDVILISYKYPFESQRRVFSRFDQNFDIKIRRKHQQNFLWARAYESVDVRSVFWVISHMSAESSIPGFKGILQTYLQAIIGALEKLYSFSSTQQKSMLKPFCIWACVRTPVLLKV